MVTLKRHPHPSPFVFHPLSIFNSGVRKQALISHSSARAEPEKLLCERRTKPMGGSTPCHLLLQSCCWQGFWSNSSLFKVIQKIRIKNVMLFVYSNKQSRKRDECTISSNGHTFIWKVQRASQSPDSLILFTTLVRFPPFTHRCLCQTNPGNPEDFTYY